MDTACSHTKCEQLVLAAVAVTAVGFLVYRLLCSQRSKKYVIEGQRLHSKESCSCLGCSADGCSVDAASGSAQQQDRRRKRAFS